MHNTKPRPIDELIYIDQQISLKLWNLTDAHTKPTGLSPHVIYPVKRDKAVRISEQEARIICCGILDNLSLYYSVETPTEKTYRQSGKKYMSAQTDLTIYTFDGQSFHRAINVEFKGPQATKKDVGKDVEKLVREGCHGGWFHILSNSNRGTFRSLFPKFKYGFIEYPKLFSPEKFSSKKISILFCFCILKRKQAYMRHFFYEPSREQYEEYVEGFFDPLQLNTDSHWHLFQAAGSTIIRGITGTKTGITKAYYHIEDHVDLGSKKKCDELWEELPDFTILQGTKGSSARHKEKPRLWFLPQYFQIAPHGKGNDVYKVLCEILHNNFTDIRGESRVLFSSQDFSWDKFENFVAYVKNTCR